MNVNPNGKNAWYNSKGFLVGAINAVIFLITSAILIRLGKKSLSKSKKILFATDLKKKLRNRGVSYIIASSISSAVGTLINISGFWLNPGSSIFNYLDKKDKKLRNGYFNGF